MPDVLKNVYKEEAPLKSMTAFGRSNAICAGRETTVEIRSVNNRYLDWSIRLPRPLCALEEQVKLALGAAGLHRGKVDVTISLTDARASTSSASSVPVMELDVDCARRYVQAAQTLCECLDVEDDITASRLLTLPGVMVPAKDTSATLTEDEAWALIQPVLAEAADSFLAARTREGLRLGEDLMGKLAGIRAMLSGLATRSEANIHACREKFEERLRALLGTVEVTLDENRLLTECALYADRVAIDEELVRLASHFDTLETLFASSEPVGRKIDFMLQETNREVNTIGSKCADAEMARTVADIKSELEKIREQIQNIE